AESASQAMTVEQVDRRQFLVRLGATTAAITVVGAGVSLVRGGRREAILSLEGPADDSDAAANTFRPADISGPEVELPNAGATVEPVPGTRPEYTPIEDHYRIDINTRPVVIDEDDWRLEITGMVDNPLMLQLSDLVENYEAREQFVTLSCISNRIGGDLISTTLWTGASLREVLADAGVQGGARYLFIESEDGFFESVDLEMVMNDERIMLAYAWDRKPLEDEHGFPLRIWIPDRYGMKQPKWIQRITVTDEYQQGYWVVRNWSEEARVKATSVVDTVAEAIETENGTIVPVGGIAYAGERGISRVQVRVNDGEWQDAEVREALADTTWAIWRFEWPFQPGRHKFEVRCYDGSGQMQILETTDNRPDGATGIHSLNASVSSPG
ncbi:MAG: molybdopterin-dependent oxidoreductase, partial [Chloroflexi bacterium]|nr:molybdopterin-dependent oxidoreductase [Chloroflexota bacterium]